MECLARHALYDLLRQSTGGLREVQDPSGAPTVSRVPHHRMAEMGQVDADLVRSPGFELTFHIGSPAVGFEHAVTRGGGPPPGRHGHALAVLGMAADGLGHTCRFLPWL